MRERATLEKHQGRHAPVRGGSGVLGGGGLGYGCGHGYGTSWGLTRKMIAG